MARIALAHDWLVARRGGELVLDRIIRALSNAHELTTIYTMFDSEQPITAAIDAMPRRVARLGRLPIISSRARRWLFPLYPSAVADLSRQLARDHDSQPIDLLISTSSAATKGMRPPPTAQTAVPHLCYCHSPARYAWARSADYAGNPLRALGLRVYSPHFRRWDRRTAAHVTRFLANSSHIAAEIRRCYDRDAEVLHPPVRTDAFTPSDNTARTHRWLVVAALEPYKRTDLAIEAAAITGAPIDIVGTGSELTSLQRLADRTGADATFHGRLGDAALQDMFRRARLLVFPQVEDFGIVAVEAQACGTPIVARAAGGALDSVIDGETGALFDEPTAEAIARAAAACPTPDVCAQACTTNAARFSEARFDSSLRRHVDSLLADRR
ncbi:MAG: glycosyltransferase [Planctomycetota bacterium]